jgi:hypothetical protein
VLIAEAPPGFNLEARKTISFQSVQRGVPPGLPCSSSSDCTSGECSGNQAVCPSGPCCLAAAGDPCTNTAACATGLVCGPNGTCAVPPTPIPLGNGQPCIAGGQNQCLSACCCNDTLAPQGVPNPSCQPAAQGGCGVAGTCNGS